MCVCVCARMSNQMCGLCFMPERQTDSKSDGEAGSSDCSSNTDAQAQACVCVYVCVYFKHALLLISLDPLQLQ